MGEGRKGGEKKGVKWRKVYSSIKIRKLFKKRILSMWYHTKHRIYIYVTHIYNFRAVYGLTVKLSRQYNIEILAFTWLIFHSHQLAALERNPYCKR